MKRNDESLNPELIHAAMNCQIEEVRRLINLQANVNAIGQDGCTPLIFAAMNDCVAVVRVLIASGARLDMQDNQGRRALDWAISLNNTNVTEILQITMS